MFRLAVLVGWKKLSIKNKERLGNKYGSTSHINVSGAYTMIWWWPIGYILVTCQTVYTMGHGSTQQTHRGYMGSLWGWGNLPNIKLKLKFWILDPGFYSEPVAEKN